MSERQKMTEIMSFGKGGVAFGCGLLGATGATPIEAKAERLYEIERRILAIEATLRTQAQSIADEGPALSGEAR